jgi:predicted DNA-binding transcriptional regulator AlpA
MSLPIKIPSQQIFQPIRIVAKPEPVKSITEKIGVNARKAAAMLGVSAATVWKLTKEGKLPCHVKLNRRYIYSVEGLRRFVGDEKFQ